MSNNKFLKGAMILGISGVIVKIIGATFKIPLTAMLGAEGLGLYGAAYPIYSMFLVISTAGIPVAISKMVSERITVRNYGGAHKVFRVALALLSVLGVASFLLCYFGAGAITSVMNNPRATMSIQAIAPALLFVPIVSAFRGYFQGRQNMNPTAISELTEQVFRAAVGLILAHSLLKIGLEEAAAGATFGASAGSLAALAIIAIIYLLSRKSIITKIGHGNNEYERTSDILKKILIIAVPITLGAAIMPIMNSIDSFVVVRRLQDTGWSPEESNKLFGLLTGYCSPLIGLPQIFTQAVAVSLVPAISAAFLKGMKQELNENISLALRTTMIIGFPCAIGMFTLAEPILLLLYGRNPARIAECEAAAPVLMVMALSVIFLATAQTLTGVLQGVSRQGVPVKNLAIGALFKMVITYVCVGITAINVKGAAIGTITAYFVAMVLDLRAVKQYTGTRFDFKLTYLIPGMASVLMGVVTFAAYKLLFMLTSSNGLATLASIAIAIPVYGALVLLLKGITKEEILRLPKGEKIVKLLGGLVK